MPTFIRALAATLVLVACADSEEPTPTAGDAGPLPVDSAANTLVVLPDTQFYSCAYPEIFEQQTRWIADVRKERHIGMVLHTGDIVDSDIDPQWRVASQSMLNLSGKVPYLVATGNHDMGADRRSLIPKYFETQAIAKFDLEADTYESTRVDNSFAVLQLAGHDWLVLGLEFGPRDNVLSWADEVLRTHADLPAIIFTHAYLYSDGQRYDRSQSPPQPYHPDSYRFTPDQGINDGEDLWRKLIVPHDNVRLVLSGHVIPHGTARSSVPRPGGGVVHQVLANYQMCDACPCSQVEGGGGYLRLLSFDGASIHIQTYSPHYDRFLTDDENDFVLDSLDL